MNILTSYNWIKKYLDTDLSPEEFALLTTASGNSVEEAIDLASRFEGMVVGVVKELKTHPNADKLQLVMTDIGKKVVQIVCGGSNLYEGQKVLVSLPGSKVRWHGEDTWTELSEAKVRGEESYGMISAAEEVGFDKLQKGEAEIMDLTALTDAPAGTPIADALKLHDILFDIEVTSNRPDCASIIGQAREGSAVTGAAFFVSTKSLEGHAEKPALSVKLKDKDLCPNYQAIRIDGVKVGPSPWWLQREILNSGHRPINNLVDITNFILHEFGQPLHTFDAEKLEGGEIVIRRAKKGEKIVALDEVEYELSPEMLVIADANRPVAVAGVMGGLETGTTEETTSVIIESATFNPVSVRRTARALNLYSDSSGLFEKGLSTEATQPALERAVELILELAGGEVVSSVTTARAEAYTPREFTLRPERVNALIGVKLEDGEMVGTLERLGFSLSQNEDGSYAVTVPYWRDNDIEDDVDLTEEIARVHGYENLPSEIPTGALPELTEEPFIVWRRRLKDIFVGAGLAETYNNAFVSENDLSRYGLRVEDAVGIKNPLSSDHGFMRPSLVPSMLNVIEQNQAREEKMYLFEIAPVYLKKKGEIPEHRPMLTLAVVEKDGEKAFFALKGILERVLSSAGVQAWYLSRPESAPEQHHPYRSAELVVDGTVVGTMGQLSDGLQQAFAIDRPAVLAEIRLDLLLPSLSDKQVYEAVPSFPQVRRDIAVVVGEKVVFEEMRTQLLDTGSLLQDVELFDVYKGKGVEDGKKSLAMHLTFGADRTLTAEEVEEEMSELHQVLEKKFDGVLRG